MVRTQIQLTEEQARKLRRVAAERGVSMAAVIREALDGVVEGPNDADARWERALRARSFPDRDGARDVSENHDRYLDEIYGDN